MMKSVNPATSETLASFEEHTAEQVELKLQAAARAFQTHRRTSFAQRAERMRRVAELLTANKQRYGRMMTHEMGKTLKSAIAEAEKCALACRHLRQLDGRIGSASPLRRHQTLRLRPRARRLRHPRIRKR